jgi:hypothetical protein
MTRSGWGKKTDHHLDFFHRRALLDRKPSSLDAGLAVPQPPRLAVGDDTARASVLSDIEFWCTICRCRGRNRFSWSVDADCDFRLFVIRQPVVGSVNRFLSSETFVSAYLRVRQSLQTSISCVKPGYASPAARRSITTTGPVLYNPSRISQSVLVTTDRESMSPVEFGSMSKRPCSQYRTAVSMEFGRGNSVGRKSHCFQSCKNSSGMTHSGVSSRSEVWPEKS